MDQALEKSFCEICRTALAATFYWLVNHWISDQKFLFMLTALIQDIYLYVLDSGNVFTFATSLHGLF